MPKWIHDRAEHLLAKNPDMDKSQAFAIATQQSHSLGKSPKGYGTSKGREEAKEKYETPHDDKKKANPGNLDSPKLAALFDEAVKIGAISDQQAQAALDRYETLERNKPTMGQVARYGALGAVSGPAIGMLGDAISGKPTGGVRGHLGRAVTGALSMGAVPLVRGHLDRQAEKHTLKKYLVEREPELNAGKLSAPFEPVEKAANAPPGLLRRALRVANELADEVDTRVAQNVGQEAVKSTHGHLREKEKDSGSGITPARAWGASETVDLVKGAFATSAYSADLGPWNIPQKSFQPGFRLPNLRKAVQHEPQQIKTSGAGDVIDSIDYYAERPDVPYSVPLRTAFGGLVGATGGASAAMLAGKHPLVGAVPGAAVIGALSYAGTKKMNERLKQKEAAGAPTRGGFLMSSEVPPFRAPQLRAAVQKQPQQIVTKLSSATTPLGRLTASKRVGLPKVSAPPGPSIAQVAKPVGFGKPMPGALKNKI